MHDVCCCGFSVASIFFRIPVSGPLNTAEVCEHYGFSTPAALKGPLSNALARTSTQHVDVLPMAWDCCFCRRCVVAYDLISLGGCPYGQ